jgi:hypothetical protein
MNNSYTISTCILCGRDYYQECSDAPDSGNYCSWSCENKATMRDLGVGDDQENNCL